MDPVDLRFLGMPGVAWLWLLTALSLAVFARRAGQWIGLLRQGRPARVWDRPWRRLGRVLVNVLGQRRLLQEPIGWAHFLFFWGFVFYASTFWWALARGLMPFLPVPYPDHIGPIAGVLDVMALLVLVAIGFSVGRRLLRPPAHLHLSADAYMILGLIATLMITQVLAQALRIVHEGPAAGAWTPVAAVVAQGLRGEWIAARAAQGSVLFWWLHMATVLAFLAYLPHSKHLHLLVAPFNVFFAAERPAADLGALGEGEDAVGGVRHWRELSWRQLLNAISCAECGRCDRVCVAVAAGCGLSPQELLATVKAHMLAEMHSDRTAAPPRSLLDEAAADGRIWGCATCMACMERCPVFNEHTPLVVQLRRALVAEGRVDAGLQEALTNLQRYGNSLGKSPRLRARWTAGLDFKIKDARREPVDVLWFVGDYASFDPRLETVVQATARLWRMAGLDFGILYDAECNAGNDARRAGEEGLFQLLRDKNRAALAKASFRRIVTTDPHTLNTLRNEYHLGNGHPIPVLHSSELLAELIDEGRLPLRRRLELRATYQDPCYLGRYNGVYEPPRRVLRALGVRLVEMPRHGANSYCCGAGGGRVWMTDRPTEDGERAAEARVREAAALPGVETLVVACPKDMAMFSDAIKTAGVEGRLRVRELAELVWEAAAEVGEPAAAPAAAP